MLGIKTYNRGRNPLVGPVPDRQIRHRNTTATVTCSFFHCLAKIRYTRYGLCLPRADRDRHDDDHCDREHHHGPQDKLRQNMLNAKLR